MPPATSAVCQICQSPIFSIYAQQPVRTDSLVSQATKSAETLSGFSSFIYLTLRPERLRALVRVAHVTIGRVAMVREQIRIKNDEIGNLMEKTISRVYVLYAPDGNDELAMLKWSDAG